MQTGIAQDRAAELRRSMAPSVPYPQRITAFINYNDTFGTRNFNDWMRFASEGLGLAHKQGDAFSAAVLQRQMGEAHYFKGRYDSAAALFHASISQMEPKGASVQLARGLNALAKLYRKTRDLPRANAIYDKAFGVFQSLNDSAGMAMIWNESGVVYEYAGDYGKAIERYTASLNMDRLLGDENGAAYALNNIAGAYLLQKRYGEAEDHLKEAMAIRRTLRDSFALALSHSDLAAVYLEASDLSAAKIHVDSSNAIATAMGYAELRQNNFGLLSQVAEKAGDYKSAYAYGQQRAALKDSLFGIEKTKQIEELNTRYETVKKEQQIEEQQHRIAQQNTMFIAGGSVVVLLALLAFTQYRRYRWKQKARLQAAVAREQEEASRAVMEAEEAERQRIAKDLHDGVGQMMSAAKMNLSAYEDKAIFQNNESRESFGRIIQLVDESCAEVRSVSHNMMPNALVKGSLHAALQEFIGKLRNDRLAIHLYAEGLTEKLDSRVETVLYRVIQESVNNVIKHSGATALDISVVRDEDSLTATVEDNGSGFDTGGAGFSEGLGLKNIQTRVAYLKGTVEIDSAPGRGTLVAVHLPLPTASLYNP